MEVVRFLAGAALLATGLLLLVYEARIDLAHAKPLRIIDRPIVLAPMAMLMLLGGLLLVLG